MTATFCSDCIALMPSSAPYWIAASTSPGLFRMSFGAKAEAATSSAKRNISVIVCGAISQLLLLVFCRASVVMVSLGPFVAACFAWLFDSECFDRGFSLALFQQDASLFRFHFVCA